MRPRSTAGASGALEILFVLYCIVLLYFPIASTESFVVMGFRSDETLSCWLLFYYKNRSVQLFLLFYCRRSRVTGISDELSATYSTPTTCCSVLRLCFTCAASASTVTLRSRIHSTTTGRWLDASWGGCWQGSGLCRPLCLIRQVSHLASVSPGQCLTRPMSHLAGVSPGKCLTWPVSGLCRPSCLTWPVSHPAGVWTVSALKCHIWPVSHLADVSPGRCLTWPVSGLCRPSCRTCPSISAGTPSTPASWLRPTSTSASSKSTRSIFYHGLVVVLDC